MYGIEWVSDKQMTRGKVRIVDNKQTQNDGSKKQWKTLWKLQGNNLATLTVPC